MDLKRKTCLITGANSGIGKYTAKKLASQGAHVVMLCRNEDKAERARREIIDETGQSDVEILIADLAHQGDIRRAADQFKSHFDKLDILINNAGMIPDERRETPEGIERSLAINHLGPFLLTNLLSKPLQQAPSPRVITVSSEVHRLGASIFDLDNLQLTTGYSAIKAYGLAKLCNIMFTHELARRYADNFTANCLHPGVVRTNLADEAGWLMKLFYTVGKPFMKSTAGGAQTSLYLATSDEVQSVTGKYFRNKEIASPSSIAMDDEITRALWDKSMALTGIN